MFVAVVNAASHNNGWVIGVDTDQSLESDRVLTSAMKNWSGAVYTAIFAYNKGMWTGNGQEMRFGASENGVCLPIESWRFHNWTFDAYYALLSEIANGQIIVSDQYPTDDMDIFSNLNVELI
jgi:basic membrane protein A